MGQEIYRSVELTGRGQNTYSGSMEGNSSPDVIPQQAAAQKELPKAPESVRHAKVVEDLAGGEISGPGIRVDKFEEKERPEYDQEKNASLSDAERAQEAANLLGLKNGLTEAQRIALQIAHNTENPSEKVKILREAGFNLDQRRVLIEAHLTGPIPTGIDYDAEIDAEVSSINPNSFSGVLRDYAARMKALHMTGQLDQRALEKFAEEIDGFYTDSGIDANQLKIFSGSVFKVMKLDNLRHPERERSEYAAFKNGYEALKQRGRHAEAEAFLLKNIEQINPQTGSIPDEIIERIAKNKEALRELINTIVATPMDSETGDYQLGFYGGNNLEAIKSYLKMRADNGTPDDKIEYQSLIDVAETTRIAHELNRAIVNADLETFSRIARSLVDRYLLTMAKTDGADSAMRLLEGEFNLTLAADKWINGENHAVMMAGARDKITGKLSLDQTNSAKESFIQMVRQAQALKALNPGAALPRELEELASLDKPWKITWAFNMGRAQHNITLRAAEKISQGELPKGDRQYVSFPQESLVRIMDWPGKFGLRFDIAKIRGGVAYLKKAMKNFSSAEAREEAGYGHTSVVRIGGRELVDFEGAAMIGVRALEATWRQKQLQLSEISHSFSAIPGSFFEGATIFRDGQAINLDGNFGQFMDTGSLSFTLRDGTTVDWEGLKDPQRAEYFRSLFMNANGELLPDIQQALGGFIYLLKPSGHDGEYMRGVKEELKTKLWLRAARENPLGVLQTLQGFQLKGEAAIELMNNPNIQVNWRDFSRKLSTLNEIRLARVRSGDLITLADLITEQRNLVDANGNHVGIVIDANGPEQQMLDYIASFGGRTHEGAEIAAHNLSNVRLAFNPWLNDAPMDVNYIATSQELFRRLLSDLGSFNATNEGNLKIMGNPFHFKEVKETEEFYMALIEGSGAVLGTDEGQNVAWPFIEAHAEAFERGSNAKNKLEKMVRQTDIVNAILQKLKKPNSIAQEFAGHMALCLDRKEMYEWSEELKLAGILSEEQEEKFRKRFGKVWQIILDGVIRGLKAAFVVGVVTTGKESFSDVPAA